MQLRNVRARLLVTVAGLLLAGCGRGDEFRHLPSQSSQALQGGQPGTPFPVSGNFTFQLLPTSQRSAGGNTIVDFDFVEQLTGSIVANRSGTGTLVLHPDGTFNVKDSGFATSAVPGVIGSVNVETWAEGTFASFSGNVTAYSQTGTGAFTDLGGVVKIQGAATGPGTLAGTYDGQLHF